ncbi:MAG: DNA polymerase I, partial [Clostridia bacterium]|nr:DNA polymerase I [Clostridia bacterium]
MKKMLVIDGNSILNRAYYGIRPLTNKNGLYTHAVYGMINIIWRHVESIKPDFCVVAFDLKAPTFRHKMYSEYKANRKGMPEELAVQLPYAKKCMTALGFKVITKEGYEADDILGTVAKNAGAEGIHSYILTGDRDSLQLIDQNVSVLLVKTKETLEYTREVFFETYGVYPEVFVDVKALMGDSSDNIPGVAGIGEKTAFKLISDFGDLATLYDAYQDSALSASVKQKLENGKELATLSQELARIDISVPLEESIDDCVFTGVRNDELYELFTELEFFGFVKKFELVPVRKKDCDSVSECEVSNTEDENMFPENSNVLLINGEQIEVFDGTICKSINISDTEALIGALNGKSVICHDYKSLYKALYKHGIGVGNCGFDTMLAAYVLNSGRGKYDIDALLSQYFGAEQKELSATSVFELYNALKREIAERGCEGLLFDIEIPLARVLADMEIAGFRIDVNGIEKYGEELAETAEALKQRIYSMAGEEFNINSPKQLGEILFEKMGLPKSKKTKTGYSTDAETLQKLASKYEIIEDILDYRQVT